MTLAKRSNRVRVTAGTFEILGTIGSKCLEYFNVIRVGSSAGLFVVRLIGKQRILARQVAWSSGAVLSVS